MLTLIKLIHTLNQQIDFSVSKFRQRVSLQTSDSHRKTLKHQEIRFQAICAIIALSLCGLGNMKTAQAKSLDFAGIRQSLQISASNQSSLEKTSPDRLRQNLISQNTTSAPTDRTKLENNLNLPKKSPAKILPNC